MVDLQDFATHTHGEVYARTYGRELALLQAHLTRDEQVLTLTTGGNSFRTGVLVITNLKLLFGLRRWFCIFDLKVFDFSPALVVKVEPHGKYAALCFTDPSGSYWITVGAREPGAEEIIGIVRTLLEQHGGTIHQPVDQ